MLPANSDSTNTERGTSVTSETLSMEPCCECGMHVTIDQYHPYAACLMFKQCHDSEVVEANLLAVIGHGYDLAYRENQPVRREDIV
jgi:hypothetical protein